MLKVLSFDKPSFINGESNNNFKVAFADKLLWGSSSYTILSTKVQHGPHAPQWKSETKGNGIFIEILAPKMQIGLAIHKTKPVMNPGEIIIIIVNVRRDFSSHIYLPAVYQGIGLVEGSEFFPVLPS